MSVKTTQSVTRDWAERRFIELKMREGGDLWRTVRSQAVLLNDIDLENWIEVENDRACGGEGFENYLIGPDHGE